MKFRMKKYFIITILIAFFASCDESGPQMERTIFIPDPIDSNLPAYTEWGYNSFGAKINRNYFLASNHIIPCKIWYKDDSLHFSISGYIGDYSETTLMFTFPSEKLYEYVDLLTLNNKRIELTVSGCEVTLTQNGKTKTLNILNGELHFRRAQKLLIDDQPNRVILSGEFNLRYISETDEFPISVSDGRFDFGINKDVFYVY